MNCPSCGAQFEVDQQYAHMAVCEYCQSAVILDEKVARVSGKMSALPRTQSPLFVGGTGKIGKLGFVVLGRVRYGYSNGFWDEWYVKADDSRTFWISEDEGNLTLELLQTEHQVPADFVEVSPGDFVNIAGVDFHVDEKEIAECEGGEGQLPFEILTGERVPFLDLSQAERFATVEYEMDGDVRVFIGKRLEPKELKMDSEPPDAPDTLAVERGAAGGSRERLVKSGDRSATIRCVSCGSPFPLPTEGKTTAKCSSCGAETDLSGRLIDCPECHETFSVSGGRKAKTAGCPSCGSRLDITRVEPTAIGALNHHARPKTPVKLGQVVNLRGERFIIVGHIRYVEKDIDGTYRSDEFLMHSRSVGYRWLIYEKGHFSYCWEIDERPQVAPGGLPEKAKFKFLGETWQVFEVSHGHAKVEWVDGELPWVAMVGDRVSYMDSISPPKMLSAEWTETEQEWYIAEYLQPTEIAEALGVELSDLPHRRDVAANQPYSVSPTKSQMAGIMLIFAAIFAYLAASSAIKDGHEIATINYHPTSNFNEEHILEAFEVKEPNTLCKLTTDSNVHNGWTYLDLALLDQEDQVLLDFSSQVSFYEGTDFEGHWTEGSRTDSKVFRVDEPGEYRFLVRSEYGDKGSHNVTLKVEEGVSISRYYLFGTLASLIFPGLFVMRRTAFEKQRWGELES